MTNLRKLLAALCLVLPLFAGGCKTFRNLPADGLIAGGSAGGAVAATAIGGPVGAAVWLSVTVASIVVAEEFVRVDPCEVVTLPGGATIPGGSSKSSPPWYLSPNYWWALMLAGVAGWLLLSFALSPRARSHTTSAMRCLFARKWRAAFLYALAAAGWAHTDAAEEAEKEATKPTEPQEPKA